MLRSYLTEPDGKGRSLLLLLLGLAAVYAMYASSVTDMLYWNSGDSVHYLHHAEQMASGAPYTETHYLPNPPAARIGPQNYPPAYPAVLAVGHKLFDGDVLNIKRFALLVWPLFGLLIYALGRWVLSPTQAVIAALAVAVNSMFWRMHDLLLSELLFLLFVALALYVYEWFAWRRSTDSAAAEPWRARVAVGLLLGSVVAVAYASRSFAVLLFPTFIVADLWRLRRVQWMTIIALSFAALIMFWQEMALGAIEAYGTIVEAGEQQAPLIEQLMGRITRLRQGLMSFFGLRLSSLLNIALLLPVLLLSVIGGVRLLWNKQLVAPVVYSGGTLALLMLLPFGQDARRLTGMAPLLAIFAVVGFRYIYIHNNRQRLLAVLGSIFMLVYGAAMAWDMQKSSVEKAAIIELDGSSVELDREMYAYIAALPEDARIFFRFPRRIAYFTSRLSSGFTDNLDVEQMQWIIDTQQLNYVVEDTWYAKSRERLQQLYQSNPEKYQPIWRNKRFSVHKIVESD